VQSAVYFCVEEKLLSYAFLPTLLYLSKLWPEEAIAELPIWSVWPPEVVIHSWASKVEHPRALEALPVNQPVHV